MAPVASSKPIRLLVPSAAGGYEVYARILAPRLAELLGQSVVVDNKPGANGIIGMQDVQRSKPDGYTFMFAHVGAISIGVSIYPNMPFDPVDEFASISVAVTSPLVWVVTPTLPFKTMKEFIAKNPDAGIAVSQLVYAKPWFATYQTVAVRKALEDEIQAMLNGKKKADAVVKDAQKKADELMKPYVDQTALKLP